MKSLEGKVIFILGLFIGALLGVVIIALVRINKSKDILEDMHSLATQAKIVGALYSMRLYNMANDYLSNKPIKDEVKCPACDVTYYECKCGLCKDKESWKTTFGLK
ncbi:hypothetical protein M0R04_16015 [Candidatus Dojkabacteria bacterium]|jgi:hypothetical protein|nr:hypothetical protein [Candidatus Dojkabacteria bacterium]